MQSMQAYIIADEDRPTVVINLKKFIDNNDNDFVIININMFYDTVDELWKCIIYYWE